MMKRTITIVSIIGSLLVILDSVNASHWIILFFLAGVVPGTDILISPIDMMAANATAFTVVMLRIFVWPQFNATLSAPAQTRSVSKKRATRRTV